MTNTIANKAANGTIFVCLMWLFSRLLIVVAIQIIAPLITLDRVEDPHINSLVGWERSGWDRFANWDGYWYRSIATLGYEYVDDNAQHSIAFFPLYPLITRGLMSLGISFPIAGTIVNNLAFLGALLVLYSWVKEHQGISAARWATAVLAWCPFSLYGTVTYTEGLFLLLSTLSLQAFDRKHHIKAGIFGALTTATRITGIALSPAFLLVAWKERRPATAYVGAIVTTSGLLLFMLYCAIDFGDPLTFLHAQRGWHAHTGDWSPWPMLFARVLDLRRGLAIAFIDTTKILMFFGGGYILWLTRSHLPRVAVVYGFCSLAMLFSSGSVVNSVHRYSYAIVSLSFALGILLSRYPRWGYATMGVFSLISVCFSLLFSWGLWVA